MRVQGSGDCVAAEIDFYGLSPIGSYGELTVAL